MSGLVIDYNKSISDEDQSFGLSDEALETYDKFMRIISEYYEPVSRQRESIVQKFYDLSLTWQMDTRFSSSIFEIAMHPAYQEVIGMGKDVIPLILQDLEKETNHWFWALSAITGVNPIQKNQRGKIKEMVDAWLKWGKENQYI